MNGLPTLLIVGGYGTVGRQIATIIRQRHPLLYILIAGRDFAKGQALAQQLGHADALRLDINTPQPLSHTKVAIDLVLATVNDPNDHLLLECVRRGIPYIDITRWTKRLHSSLQRLNKEVLNSPTLFASGWMAGSIAAAIANHIHRHGPVETIDIDVLFYLADKAGPDSVEYMDRLTQPFWSWQHNKRVQQQPLTQARKLTFPSGKKVSTYRFETPDLYTLHETLGAATLNTRIAFDSRVTMQALIFAKAVGILKMLSNPRFDNIRHRIMHNPGAGAPHEVLITFTGPAGCTALSLVDPLGQTHLTACGAVAQLEWIGGLTGERPTTGILFPEQHPDTQRAINVLRENGVRISYTDSDDRLQTAAPCPSVLEK